MFGRGKKQVKLGAPKIMSVDGIYAGELLLKAQLGTPLYGRLFSHACASTEILCSTGDIIQATVFPAWIPFAIAFGP